ncbi:HD domain-containing phosphohydrolase [Chloroflexota bacterium]
MDKDIRILVVDDHQVVREGLRHLLEREEDMAVVGQGTNSEEALFQIEILSPDIVLMDIKMPGMDGIELTRQVKQKYSSCNVIMLTLYDEYLTNAMEAGANGYLLKDIKREELAQAIRQVHRGEVVISKSIISKYGNGYEEKRANGKEVPGIMLEELQLVIPPPIEANQLMRFTERVEEILQEGSYSTEDRRLLHKVLSEVATGTVNTHLYEGVQRKRTDLKKVQGGILHAMALAVETRDPYTGGHQQQVAELACKIATEMGLSEWDIEGIRIMGLLHDVGKITVPVEILCKPGNINQYEFSIIKTHARVGHEILKEIEFPWPITKVILQHHERLNGSGYPEGLSGKDITLDVRILGVADVIAAMSSHRPYRPALGFDCVLEEIRQKRGTLYDPEVVDACLKLFQKNGVEKSLERK